MMSVPSPAAITSDALVPAIRSGPSLPTIVAGMPLQFGPTGVAVGDGVGAGVGDGVAVAVGVGVGDGDGDGVSVGEGDGDGVAVAVGACEGVAVGGGVSATPALITPVAV